MKNKEFKTSSSEELTKLVAKKEQEIRTLRFSLQGTTNKNTKAYRDARKSIARAKTALRAHVG